jgi:hypothetical protein
MLGLDRRKARIERALLKFADAKVYVDAVVDDFLFAENAYDGLDYVIGVQYLDMGDGVINANILVHCRQALGETLMAYGNSVLDRLAGEQLLDVSSVVSVDYSSRFKTGDGTKLQCFIFKANKVKFFQF